MRGPKRNDGATAVGERPGTRATAKYVRSSAYKARVVLDLIRGLDVFSADQVLQFTERGIARDIRKVLASAVANATSVDNGAYIGDAEELFVLACYADEGPTLRRFRPRARGRATRIRKRSCHITIIVARMSAERLDILQARAEGSGRAAAASRAARVEKSRQRAAEAKAAVDEVASTEGDDEASETEEVVDSTDSSIAEEVVTEDQATEDDAAQDDTVEDAAATAEEGSGEYAAGQWAGSVLPAADGSGPDSHPIKGNADSMLYHTPDSRYYKVTKAAVWFDTEESAEAAGFSRPGTTNSEDEDS